MANKDQILLVDDDENLRSILESELIKEGYSVTKSANGEEAISLIQKKNFDLVLLDIKMPRVDGFEVLRFIKKNFPHVKVIMLTAYGDLANVIESKKCGADDFVGKPYDLVDLFSSINRVLSV